MIQVTRLSGPEFSVNADLIERIEATPETVLTLIDGKRLLVAETVAEVIERITAFRAGVLAHVPRVPDGIGRVEPILHLVVDEERADNGIPPGSAGRR